MIEGEVFVALIICESGTDPSWKQEEGLKGRIWFLSILISKHVWCQFPILSGLTNFLNFGCLNRFLETPAHRLSLSFLFFNSNTSLLILNLRKLSFIFLKKVANSYMYCI